MKNIALLFICILFTLQSYAQAISFTDTSNKWKCFYHDIGFSSRHYNYYFKDTSVLLGAHTYQVLTANLIETNSGGHKDQVSLIREDTLLQKVFIKVYKGDEFTSKYIDTFERVLYDYSLQPGDTFTMINSQGTFKHYLSSIDTISIANANHRVFHLKAIQPSYAQSYDVIEGVGTTLGMFFPLYPINYFDMWISLLCFYNNSNQPKFNPPISNFDNSSPCKTSIANIANSKNLVILPQPSNGQFDIKLPEQASGHIEIYNMNGQSVFKQDIIRRNILSIDMDVPEGMYFYKIYNTQNEKNEVYTGKLTFY